MSKNTPGPWCFKRESMPEVFGDKFNISQQDGAPYTSNYSDVAITCSGDPIAVQEANARLIAAAPELLEALKELMEYSGLIEERCDCVATNKARAAIAKAEGQS